MNDFEPILTLLTEIRNAVLRQQNDAKEKSNAKREKHRLAQAKYRKKLNHVISLKEGKGKEETFPPAPPIEKKGESPEKTAAIMLTCARVCVCACEGLTPEREIALASETAHLFERISPPCRFEVIAWAHRVWRNAAQDDLINTIFDDLRQNGWTNPLTGKRIGNWSAFIRRVIAKRLPPREFAKAVQFKKNRPINILERTEAEIMEQWGINDGQG